MEELIKQAFLHVEIIGPHVADGHYDLIANGEIILPQVWETMIEPDISITMHMWPMPEPKPTAPVVPDVRDVDPAHRGAKHGHFVGGKIRVGPPPAPNIRNGGAGNHGPAPTPPGYIGPVDPGHHPGISTVKEPSKKKKQSFGILGFGTRPSSKPSGKGLFSMYDG